MSKRILPIEPSNYFFDFANYFKKISNGIWQMNDLIQQSIKLSDNAFSQFRSVVEAFNQTLPDIRSILNKALDFSKFKEEEKKALVQSGWFICPSLGHLPYHYLRKAVIQYNSGRKNSITNLMKSWYSANNWENLEIAVNSWSVNKFFSKQRRQIINDALDAHKKGKYTLSIPAILPIIEGIAGDFCKSQNITLHRGATSQKARVSLSRISNNEEMYLSEAVFSFIENQLYVSTTTLKNSKNRKYLNRHGILHGSYSGYSDCARSLRCFLLLDVFSLLKK